MTPSIAQSPQYRVLLVDQDNWYADLWTAGTRQVAVHLESERVLNFSDARQRLSRGDIQVVFADLDLSGRVKEAEEFIEYLRRVSPESYLVLITENESVETIRKANALEVDDFIIKGPLYAEEVALHLRSFSEQRRLRVALENSRANYHNLFQLAPLPLLIVRLDDLCVLEVNEAAASLFDVEVKRLKGTPLSDWLETKDKSDLVRRLQGMEIRGGGVLDELCAFQREMEGRTFRGRVRLVSHGFASAAQIGLEDLERMEDHAHSARYVSAHGSQGEKLAAVGQIMSGIAHEINNPMSVIMGLSLLMLEEPALADFKEDLSMIAKSADRCNRILQDLLRFMNLNNLSVEEVRLDDLLAATANQFRPQCEVRNLELVEAFDTHEVMVSVDRGLIEHVVVAILTNAMDAITKANVGGEIHLRSKVLEGRVQIQIENDGPPIPDTAKARVFDPFFTTKGPGQGTGLSLSYCYGIVKEHFGELMLEESNEIKTVFSLDLPILLEGLVTSLESSRNYQATPAVPVVVYGHSPESATLLCQVLQEDPMMTLTLAGGEEDLLDQVASVQPNIVVVSGTEAYALTELVGSLRCLVFRDALEVVVYTDAEGSKSIPSDAVFPLPLDASFVREDMRDRCTRILGGRPDNQAKP